MLDVGINFRKTSVFRKATDDYRSHRATPPPKPKWARREAHEEIEMYLEDQVTAFKDFVISHVPHYIIEKFLYRYTTSLNRKYYISYSLSVFFLMVHHKAFFISDRFWLEYVKR